MFIATVIVSIALSIVFLGGAIPKVLDNNMARKMREPLGVSASLNRVVGLLEIAAAGGLLVGLAVPALGVAAAGGLALLMIAAIGAHFRVGDGKGALPATVMLVVTVAAVVLRILSM